MAKRLNDTRAIAEGPYGSATEHNISSRKVENGYIVRESSCNPTTGEYKSTERFSKTVPRLIAGRVAYDSPEGPGLADTMNYLSGKSGI